MSWLINLDPAVFNNICKGEHVHCFCLDHDRRTMVHSSCCPQTLHLDCFITAMKQQEGCEWQYAYRSFEDSLNYGNDGLYCSACRKNGFTRVSVTSFRTGEHSVEILDLSVPKNVTRARKSDIRRERLMNVSSRNYDEGIKHFHCCFQGVQNTSYWPRRVVCGNRFRPILVDDDTSSDESV